MFNKKEIIFIGSSIILNIILIPLTYFFNPSLMPLFYIEGTAFGLLFGSLLCVAALEWVFDERSLKHG